MRFYGLGAAGPQCPNPDETLMDVLPDGTLVCQYVEGGTPYVTRYAPSGASANVGMPVWGWVALAIGGATAAGIFIWQANR